MNPSTRTVYNMLYDLSMDRKHRLQPNELLCDMIVSQAR